MEIVIDDFFDKDFKEYLLGLDGVVDTNIVIKYCYKGLITELFNN